MKREHKENNRNLYPIDMLYSFLAELSLGRRKNDAQRIEAILEVLYGERKDNDFLSYYTPDSVCISDENAELIFGDNFRSIQVAYDV